LAVIPAGPSLRIGISARRKETLDVVVVVAGQAKLLEVVGTPGAVGCLTYLLHSRQQQADQDGNDGDDHEKFDKGEGPRRPVAEDPANRAHKTTSQAREMRRASLMHPSL